MRRLALVGLTFLTLASVANAQCSGIQPTGSVCGAPIPGLAKATRDPVLGVSPNVAGSLGLAAAAGGTIVTLKAAPTTGTYDFIFPTGIGTVGLPLLSGGAGSPLAFGTLGTPGGGTGFASYAVGDLLFANTTTTLAKLADVATGNAVISGGVGVAPSWGKINQTTHITGVTPVANGGTNCSVASGTCIDNVSGFASTGIMSRTGAGTYTFSTESVLLDVIGSTRGSVLYRGAAGWAALTPGTSTFVLASGGAGADPSWVAAGSGTVTNIASGQGLTGGPITTTGTLAINLTKAQNTLGADVALNNTANYFDGPSMAQGTTGTWFVSGNATLSDTVQATFRCKLWDGTTVIASASHTVPVSAIGTIALSGYMTSPAANIRISCRDVSSTGGLIVFNNGGSSTDSSIWGIRIN